jgi:hypothetical protein
LKKTHHKKRAGGVAQGEGPEFKPSKKKKGKCHCGKGGFILGKFCLPLCVYVCARVLLGAQLTFYFAFFSIFLLTLLLGMEPRVSCMLGKCSTTDSQLLFYF